MSRAILMLLVAAVVVQHVAFVQADQAGPTGDATVHLGLSLDVLDRLQAATSPLEAVRVLYDRGTSYYPPFLSLVTSPFHALLGPSLESALYGNLVFLLTLLFSAWSLGSTLWGRTGGLLAAFLAVTAPGVLGQAETYYQDVPVAAMVLLNLALLHSSDRFHRAGPALLAGLTFGLGMLTKPNFWVFVWPAWLLLAPWGRDRRPWGLLALAGSCAALVAGPWYSLHGPEILQDLREVVNPNALRLHSNTSGHVTVAGILVHLPALLGNLSHVLVLAPVFLLLLFECALAPWRRELRPALPLLACLAAAILFLGFSPAYSPRYLVPLAPMVAVLVGWWATLPPRVAAAPVLVVLLAAGIQAVAWVAPLRQGVQALGWEPPFRFYSDVLPDECWSEPVLFPVRLPLEGADESEALVQAVGSRPALLVTLCHSEGQLATRSRVLGMRESTWFLTVGSDGRLLQELHRPERATGELPRLEAVAVPADVASSVLAGTLPGWPPGLDLGEGRLVGAFEVPALCARNPQVLLFAMLRPRNPLGERGSGLSTANRRPCASQPLSSSRSPSP